MLTPPFDDAPLSVARDRQDRQTAEPPEEQAKNGREPATYSAGKDSLNWTKL